VALGQAAYGVWECAATVIVVRVNSSNLRSRNLGIETVSSAWT